MNTEQYEAKLLAEKNIVEDELSAIAKRNPESKMWEATPENQSAPQADENDLSTRATDFEERSAMAVPLNNRLRDLNKALKNIKNDTYGICEVCGNPTEEARLQANPAARTCEACMNL